MGGDVTQRLHLLPRHRHVVLDLLDVARLGEREIDEVAQGLEGVLDLVDHLEG